MEDLIINFDDLRAKRELLTKLGTLKGKRRLTISNVRPRRSDRANRFYWPCVCVPFAEWLTETQGEKVTPDQAHEILKHTFLRVPVINKETGEQLFAGDEPIMRTRSSTELDTAEFSEFVENCRDLLAELCGIIVPDPDPDYANQKEVTHAGH